MAFRSLEKLCRICSEKNIALWQAIMQQDMEQTGAGQEDSRRRMEKIWQEMLFSLDSYRADELSASGMVGSEGAKMEKYIENGAPLCGGFVGKVIANALKMGCNNACMKRIVAAPTAGACGVLPAVLVTYYRENHVDDETMLRALYVAAGIGAVIAHRASLAGASGGCQAEIGAASAMAAGAICFVRGADEQTICHACAMALKNLMGLVCDPVAGLVEIPCVKRNVIGAVNALSAADMALAGIQSQIPVDQVIDAMKDVGDKMDASLRETAMGGIAATPRGLEIAKSLKNQKN